MTKDAISAKICGKVNKAEYLVVFFLCAAAPENNKGDEVLKNIWIICPSVYIHTYVCPSSGPQVLSKAP